MKGTENGLHKLTETQLKIHALLAKDKYSESDTANFTVNEKDELADKLAEILDSYKGDRKKVAAFLNKIEPIVSTHVKNQIWESNHINVTAAIAKLMPEFRRMPSTNEIADYTGLSRKEVHKHLSEYSTNPLFLQQVKQFRFVAAQVLAEVFKFAVNGDIRAARLYFDMVDRLDGSGPNNVFVQNQNNYIQINGLTLSQESIKWLNEDQLEQIEGIFRVALPKQELPK